MSGARLVDLNETFDPRVFHEFYDEILRPAMPPSELEEEDLLEERIRGGMAAPTVAAVAMSADGRVGGGVVGDWYLASRCLLVSYVAVRPELRGQGMGGALMRDVVGDRWARLGPELLLAEIDDPRVASGVGGGNAAARIRFFSRHSARLLRMPYLQPEVRPGGGRVRMLLTALVDGSARLSPGDEAVDAPLVRVFLEEYFDDAEGQDPPEGLLRWTRAESGVRVLPLDRYEDIPSDAWEFPTTTG